MAEGFGELVPQAHAAKPVAFLKESTLFAAEVLVKEILIYHNLPVLFVVVSGLGKFTSDGGLLHIIFITGEAVGAEIRSTCSSAEFCEIPSTAETCRKSAEFSTFDDGIPPDDEKVSKTFVIEENEPMI